MLHTPGSVYVIAEAGVNHNGDEKLALNLIDIAAKAGADAVKFQLFSPEAVVTKGGATADYQASNLKDKKISQQDMLKKLTLPEGSYEKLASYCNKRKIDFLCTPFDHGSLHYLVKHTQMRYLKLASGEVTNGPLLLAAARTGLPIILSTGMCDLDDISVALSILHFGYEHNTGHPSHIGVATPQMLRALSEKVTLMHCVSQYPASISSTNLLAMDTLAETFNLPVGLSDHSLGSTMAVAAAARGACMIEKHFTHDVKAPGPDHAASLSADGLQAMIAAIRDVSLGLGDGEKICRPEERNTREIARRSIVAGERISKGTIFTKANIICKRPGPDANRIEPNRLWELLGKASIHDYAADAFIRPEELL